MPLYNYKIIMIGLSQQSNQQSNSKNYSQQKINEAVNCILNKNLEASILILKGLILDHKNVLNTYQFIGLGNIQNWSQCLPNDPIQWFYQHQNSVKNPFDLLSITLMMGKHFKILKTQQIISLYEELYERFQGVKIHQIEMGLGNAYYNDYQILKAEQHYFKALEMRETQKVFEYISWIKIFYFGVYQKQNVFAHYIQKCLSFNPRSKYALLMRSINRDDRSIAIKQLKQLRQQFTEYYRLNYQLAFFQQSGSEEQIMWLDKALAIDPQYIHAFIKKAMWIEQKKPQIAQEMIQVALKKYSQSDWVYINLGAREYDLKNYEISAKYFFKCLQINPYRFKAHNYIALIYEATNNYHEAIQHHLKYVELNPYNSGTFNSLAYCSYNINQFEQQFKYYMLGYEQEPANQTILNNLGKFYFRNKQYQKAITYFQKHYQVSKSAQTCYFISKCYRLTATIQTLPTIKTWAQRCAQLGGDASSSVFKHLFDVCLFMKQYDEAITWLLKSACKLNSLANTNSLLEDMDDHLYKSQQVDLLKKYMQNYEKNYENIFGFLQLLALFEQLKSQQEIQKCLRVIRELARGRDDLHPMVRVAIRSPYWKRAALKEEDQVNYVYLLDQYSKQFSQMYKAQQLLMKDQSK